MTDSLQLAATSSTSSSTTAWLLGGISVFIGVVGLAAFIANERRRRSEATLSPRFRASLGHAQMLYYSARRRGSKLGWWEPLSFWIRPKRRSQLRRDQDELRAQFEEQVSKFHRDELGYKTERDLLCAVGERVGLRARPAPALRQAGAAERAAEETPEPEGEDLPAPQAADAAEGSVVSLTEPVREIMDAAERSAESLTERELEKLMTRLRTQRNEAWKVSRNVS